MWLTFVHFGNSAMFSDALHEMLDFIFQDIRKELLGTVYGFDESDTKQVRIVEQEDDDQSEEQVLVTKKAAPPLAKLIPQLKSEIARMYQSESTFWKELEHFQLYYEALFFQQENTPDWLVI